jgi:hypothetical protein
MKSLTKVEVAHHVLLDELREVLTPLSGANKSVLHKVSAATAITWKVNAYLFGVPANKKDCAKRLPPAAQEMTEATRHFTKRHSSRGRVRSTHHPSCSDLSDETSKQTPTMHSPSRWLPITMTSSLI